MGEWQHGLFGCFDNCMVCIVTYFVPCYSFGKVAESVGESCLLCGLVTFVPLVNIFCAAKIRGKVRENKGIEGGFVNDLLMSCCCFFCSVAQEAQEMNAVGSQSITRE